MRTREQEYAVAVFKRVDKVKKDHPPKDGKGDPYLTKYGSMAHKLPVLIRTAGLAQALAFVYTREEKRGGEIGPLHQLLNDLAEVVLGENDGAKLAKRSREAQLGVYMRLTEQALAALVWYKRFAESVLDVKATTEVPSGAADGPPTAPAPEQDTPVEVS
ncbi:MAG: type III-B CRISPR module-associated protein Cmr5 [Chloroflexota bacterium]|nr:type III-B CRISPR module-associated protein Cmr5 [Chloroflexota bacterium]